MARESLVDQGLGRVRSAIDNIDGEMAKLRKTVRSRTRTLEKRFERSRKDLGKQTRKRMDRVLSDLRKRPAYRRAEELRKDTAKRVEHGVESCWSSLNVASKNDLQRVDRRLGQLRRKLNEVEKLQSELERAQRHPAPSEPRTRESRPSA